jgi:GNAT superfamily N-acetyltransferase
MTPRNAGHYIFSGPAGGRSFPSNWALSATIHTWPSALLTFGAHFATLAQMDMPARIEIRQATRQDAAVVQSILTEAAQWLEQTGRLQWRESELSPEAIAADVAAGLFFLAEVYLAEVQVAENSRDAAGTVKFQLEDPLFWPDLTLPDAAYVHRLAVHRRYAGTGVSTALLAWAAERTRALGRHFLRLDCEASRIRLRTIYESFGFRHHSDRQVGSYFVSRYEYDVRNLDDVTNLAP